MGKSKYSRELFEKMLHEQQNGKPVAGICNEHGIDVKQYHYWKKKFEQGESGTTPAPKKKKKKYKKAAVEKVVKKEPKIPGRKIDFYFGSVIVKKGYVLNVEYQSEETFFSVSKEEE